MTRKPRYPPRIHGCPVEQVRLFVARPTQPGIPVAGLVPAIHAFFPFDGALGEDVGGRDKPGHGGSKVVYFSAVPPCGCDETLNRTVVGLSRPSASWVGRAKDVDTRVKPAQDDKGVTPAASPDCIWSLSFLPEHLEHALGDNKATKDVDRG